MAAQKKNGKDVADKATSKRVVGGERESAPKSELKVVKQQKRKPWSAEAKAKMSQKMKKYYSDPANKQKIVDGWDEDARKEHSEKMKKVLAPGTEAHRKMKAGLKRWSDERKAIREAQGEERVMAAREANPNPEQ